MSENKHESCMDSGSSKVRDRPQLTHALTDNGSFPVPSHSTPLRMSVSENDSSNENSFKNMNPIKNQSNIVRREKPQYETNWTRTWTDVIENPGPSNKIPIGIPM